MVFIRIIVIKKLFPQKSNNRTVEKLIIVLYAKVLILGLFNLIIINKKVKK